MTYIKHNAADLGLVLEENLQQYVLDHIQNTTPIPSEHYYRQAVIGADLTHLAVLNLVESLSLHQTD